MCNAPARASVILFLLTALVATASPGQPPDGKSGERKGNDFGPSYTAFPNLKPPTLERKEIKNAEGKTEGFVYEETDVVPLPPVPAVAPDAPLLRQVLFAQTQAGLDYLTRIKERIRIGAYSPDEFTEFLVVAREVYRVAAELEAELAKRVPWYEARVRTFKDFERFILQRAGFGTDPPQRLDVIRFHRLGTEADLLKLMAALPAAKAAPVTLPPKVPELPRTDSGPVPGRMNSIPPAYTAFPELKPPYFERKEVKEPGEDIKYVYEEKGIVPLPPIPPVGTDAPSLRQALFAKIQAGQEFLATVQERIRIGAYSPDGFRDHVNMTAEFYRAAAELEAEPAKRVPWYEARVRALKGFERFIQLRAEIGTDPLQRLDTVRFHRLGTEADLLVLQATLPAAEAAPPPATLPPRVFDPRRPDPPQPRKKDFPPIYTAFPNLKPPTSERKEVERPGGPPEIVYEEKGVVPPPPLPTVAADAPLLRQALFAQAQAGQTYVVRIKERIRIGAYTPDEFRLFLGMAADTYRVAAELETEPAKRIPWFEARVRTLKEAERFILLRVAIGTDPPQRLSSTQFDLLQAETNLLTLMAEVETASVRPPASVCPPVCCRPTPCPRPRGGLFARLFHRR